jgi:hypothetical protein
MPCSNPSFRELSDHDVIWRVLQLVDEDQLHSLAEGGLKSLNSHWV